MVCVVCTSWGARILLLRQELENVNYQILLQQNQILDANKVFLGDNEYFMVKKPPPNQLSTIVMRNHIFCCTFGVVNELELWYLNVQVTNAKRHLLALIATVSALKEINLDVGIN